MGLVELFLVQPRQCKGLFEMRFKEPEQSPISMLAPKVIKPVKQRKVKPVKQGEDLG